MAIKLGIIANEFFEPTIGRMGGFGWAARQVAKFFRSHLNLAVNVVFLAAGISERSGLGHTYVHDTLLLFQRQGPEYKRLLLEQAFDLILSVDYRPRYRELFQILNRVPVIIWVRDPKPPELLEKLTTLRIPTAPSVLPQGLNPINCTSLSRLVDDTKVTPRRPFLLATPALSLVSRIEGAYGIAGSECAFLPNIVDLHRGAVGKNLKPRVVFLGRLDPIKRPWLFVELARSFPTVEFLMLGQSHFSGPGTWKAKALPQNVNLLGHVDGTRKFRLLSSAWVLVNTSIHEGLPTSFLEALTCETPLLACTNQDEVVSRFGLFIGTSYGDGMNSLPCFVDGLRKLLEDEHLRKQLGSQGRAWVEQTHNSRNFLAAFDTLCERLGLRRQPAALPNLPVDINSTQGRDCSTG